jgi:hypothetical protein
MSDLIPGETLGVQCFKVFRERVIRSPFGAMAIGETLHRRDTLHLQALGDQGIGWE